MALGALDLLSQMPFIALQPYFLCLAWIALTVAGLQLPIKQRVLMFLSAYFCVFWSLLSITPLTTAWSPPYLDYCLGIGCIVNIFMVPRIFLFDKHQAVGPEPPKIAATTPYWGRDALVASVRIPLNPRDLPRPRHRKWDHTWVAFSVFALQRLGRIALLFSVNRFLVQRFAEHVLSDMLLDDLLPDRQSLIRRLIFNSRDITRYEIDLRVLVSLHWIWMNVVYIESYHDILAILFVCVLQIDATRDWPSLFGSPAEAYTIKRFWGTFWHRLTAPSFSRLASIISRQIARLTAGSIKDKTAIAFLIFLFSGIGHAVVAWRIGESGEFGDVVFYILNFCGIAMELLIAKLIKKTSLYQNLKTSGVLARKDVRIIGRVLGFLWVFAWLLWCVPRWHYPKLHHRRSQQLELEFAVFFGEV